MLWIYIYSLYHTGTYYSEVDNIMDESYPLGSYKIINIIHTFALMIFMKMVLKVYMKWGYLVKHITRLFIIFLIRIHDLTLFLNRDWIISLCMINIYTSPLQVALHSRTTPGWQQNQWTQAFHLFVYEFRIPPSLNRNSTGRDPSPPSSESRSIVVYTCVWYLFHIESFHSFNDFWCIHQPQHGIQGHGIVRIKLIGKIESILKYHI